MRLPPLRRRIVAIPILTIGIALALVYADVIFARRLEVLAIVLMIYVGIEALFGNRRVQRRKR
jgi:hypothetical protein